ncbi:hypothetical protein AB4K20DRAFT_1990091 [Rhizopus microsporus]
MFFKKLLSRSRLLSVGSLMMKTSTALLKMAFRIAFRVSYTLARGVWRIFLCIASNALEVMLSTLAIVSEEIKNAVFFTRFFIACLATSCLLKRKGFGHLTRGSTAQGFQVPPQKSWGEIALWLAAKSLVTAGAMSLVGLLSATVLYWASLSEIKYNEIRKHYSSQTLGLLYCNEQYCLLQVLFSICMKNIKQSLCKVQRFSCSTSIALWLHYPLPSNTSDITATCRN